MAVNVYECMLLFDSSKYASDPSGIVGQVHATMEKNHAEILASRPWDERRLAYPVHGHKKGTYFLVYFRGDGKNLTSIDKDFALNESLLRYLFLKVDKKMEETMLALARDEHALAVQAPGLQEESTDAKPVSAPEAVEQGRR